MSAGPFTSQLVAELYEKNYSAILQILQRDPRLTILEHLLILDGFEKWLTHYDGPADDACFLQWAEDALQFPMEFILNAQWGELFLNEHRHRCRTVRCSDGTVGDLAQVHSDELKVLVRLKRRLFNDVFEAEEIDDLREITLSGPQRRKLPLEERQEEMKLRNETIREAAKMLGRYGPAKCHRCGRKDGRIAKRTGVSLPCSDCTTLLRAEEARKEGRATQKQLLILEKFKNKASNTPLLSPVT